MLKKLSQMLLVSVACSTLAAQAQSPAMVETGTNAATSTAQSATNSKNLPIMVDGQLPNVVPAEEKPDGWKLFTPPARDFKILMPPNVQRKVDNEPGKSTTQYFQKADDVDLVVTDGSYITVARRGIATETFYLEATNKIRDQLRKSNSSVTQEVSAVDGKGWQGRQVLFKANDKILATVRVVFSTNRDAGYKLLATAGPDNPKVKTFLDSFEVDPEIAAKAHLDSASSAEVKNVVNVVWPLSVLVLGAIGVSLIVAAIRNRTN